jgi:hypothetical protein
MNVYNKCTKPNALVRIPEEISEFSIRMKMYTLISEGNSNTLYKLAKENYIPMSRPMCRTDPDNLLKLFYIYEEYI